MIGRALVRIDHNQIGAQCDPDGLKRRIDPETDGRTLPPMLSDAARDKTPTNALVR